MTEQHALSLSWLTDFRPAINLPVDLILEARQEDPEAPQFEYGSELPAPKAVLLPANGEESRKWIETIRAEVRRDEWQVCLTNLVAIPARSIRSDIEGMPVFDGAAFLGEVLKNCLPGKVIVALIPASILMSNTATPLRAWLSKAHRVEWIIYLGAEAAQLFGAHSRFALAIMVIRSGPTVDDAAEIIRLVNLATTPRTEWVSTLAAAKRRGGGEVESSIILRNPELGGEPWTYERFSQRFAATREDAKHLGTLRPLREFAKSIRLGLHRTVEGQRIVKLAQTGAAPSGAVVCFGGRSIGRGGTLLEPVSAVVRSGLSDEMFLQPGDILVRSVLNLGSDTAPVLAAIVPKTVLPATFDQSCIRIRWGVDFPKHGLGLIEGYLNSTHARDWFIAHGVQLTLNAATLGGLEVPDPSKEVLGALEVLSDAENQYREWAKDAASARLGLFTATSLRERLPALLSRQRIEIERLRAARDAESINYQIRNYYPHPIALRREVILQAESGKPKIEAVLDCAEHLLTLLAVLAILQESWTSADPRPVRARMLSYVRDNSLHFDWGKCAGLLQEGVHLTAGHPNPLALRFPELAELAAPIADKNSGWSKAEKTLRDWRNRFAHLQLLPDPELNKLSDELLDELNRLLETASFISTVPLVHVADYELDPVTGQRSATFSMLAGISPVFQRSKREVATELPRGAVGFLTPRGDFISAFPWLTMNVCPQCKRPEVFVFNRYERNVVTCIAMETGHPHDNPNLAQSIAAAIRTEVRA